MQASPKDVYHHHHQCKKIIKYRLLMNLLASMNLSSMKEQPLLSKPPKIQQCTSSIKKKWKINSRNLLISEKISNWFEINLNLIAIIKEFSINATTVDQTTIGINAHQFSQILVMLPLQNPSKRRKNTIE